MRSTCRSLHVLLPSLALGFLVMAAGVTVVTIHALGISPSEATLHGLRTLHTALAHLHLPIVEQCPGSLPGGC